MAIIFQPKPLQPCKILYFYRMKQQKKAYLFALSAILLWSTVGSAFKISLRYISFIELLFYAALVSTITLLLVLIFSKKLNLLLTLKPVNFLRASFLGLLNPFLYYVFLLQAYNLLLAQEAGTLNYIWPVVLVLLSIPLLKQKIGWISLAAILISFTGTVIIGTQGNLFSLKFSNVTGVGLALGSAIFWALFWIINVKDTTDAVIKLFLSFAFGLIYITIYLVFTKGFSPPPLRGLAGAVYLGLFEMGITFVLWLMALKHSATTAKVSNLVYISPFISLFFIRFAVGETILISTILGLMLIVGGILLQQYAGRFAK
jgi:drug/metabolite transporter (DMT)-like permease